MCQLWLQICDNWNTPKKPENLLSRIQAVKNVKKNKKIYIILFHDFLKSVWDVLKLICFLLFAFLDQSKTQKEEAEGKFERNSLESLEILELLCQAQNGKETASEW